MAPILAVVVDTAMRLTPAAAVAGRCSSERGNWAPGSLPAVAGRSCSVVAAGSRRCTATEEAAAGSCCLVRSFASREAAAAAAVEEEGGVVMRVAFDAKRAAVGVGARMLFYPTLVYNVVRNRFEPHFHWWDQVDEVGKISYPLF